MQIIDLTTNMAICVAEPRATPNVISWMAQTHMSVIAFPKGTRQIFKKTEFVNWILLHTNLFLKAKMIAPACSAAFPTIGSKITLMKLTDKPQDSDAACNN